MSSRAAESRLLSLSPAKTPNPTKASTATPAPTPMPAATPELSPDVFSIVGLAEAVGSAVTLTSVPPVCTAVPVVEVVGEFEAENELDDSVVCDVANFVERCSVFDWDSDVEVEEVVEVVEAVEAVDVVVSLAAEVEEELIDDCGVLVPALDPLTEVNPTKISVVTG
jgi:hypothetical protein